MTRRFLKHSEILVLIILLFTTSLAPAQITYKIDISFVDLDNQPVPFSTFEGKYMVIDLFAEWCEPCKFQMVHLKDIYEVINDEQDVDLFSLDVWPETDTLEVVREFKDQYDADWDFGLDINATFRDTYEVDLYPTTLILSPNGKILKKWIGITESDDILKELDKYVELEGRLGRALNIDELLTDLFTSPAFYLFMMMIIVFIYIIGLQLIRKRKVNTEGKNLYPDNIDENNRL